jgi:hypothetical protein
MTPAELERMVREDQADLEDARHEQRMIIIGICAIGIGYLSSRYAATRRKEIVNGYAEHADPKLLAAKREWWP